MVNQGQEPQDELCRLGKRRQVCWFFTSLIFLAIITLSMVTMFLKPIASYGSGEIEKAVELSPLLGVITYPDYYAGLLSAVVLSAGGFVISTIQFENERRGDD